MQVLLEQQPLLDRGRRVPNAPLTRLYATLATIFRLSESLYNIHLVSKIAQSRLSTLAGFTLVQRSALGLCFS
jgi:hypothetical protein